MTMLEIIEFPNRVLTNLSTPIDVFDHSVEQLVKSMIETMYVHGGVGLAAPQVGVSKTVVIIDPSAGDVANQLLILVNPRVIWRSEEMDASDEGCLSLPGVTLKVPRSLSVTIEYHDIKGVLNNVTCAGFDARIAQHEIDHIDGIMMLDHVGQLARIHALKDLGKNK